MDDPKAWPELEEIIVALQQHRDGISRDIAVVEQCRKQRGDPEMQLIVHYIVNGKLAAVVDYAKAQGWRVATDKPKGRQYTLDDIRELLSNPPEGWTKELIGLAYSSYWTERRLIDRGEIM